jgi:F-type H+-transporting ATPase subunit epsilon
MAPISSELKCVVVTPERALLDARADSVVLPLYDGELGVLPGRAPLMGRLGFGELRIRKGDKTTYLYIDGGFVQVLDNTVSVLTPRALQVEEINPDAARQALSAAEAALKKAVGPAEQDAQLVAQQKAREQIRVARHRSAGTRTDTA